MKIIELQEMKLVGLRVVCEGDQYVSEIPKATMSLKNRINEIRDIRIPARFVGAFIVGDYSEEEDGYWVCVEVEQLIKVPTGMVALTIPSQRYAVISHSGPNTEIWKTYETLHKWEEDNGLVRIQRSWHLEISDVWGDNETNVVNVELYDTIQ